MTQLIFAGVSIVAAFLTLTALVVIPYLLIEIINTWKEAVASLRDFRDKGDRS